MCSSVKQPHSTPMYTISCSINFPSFHKDVSSSRGIDEAFGIRISEKKHEMSV